MRTLRNTKTEQQLVAKRKAGSAAVTTPLEPGPEQDQRIDQSRVTRVPERRPPSEVL